jgi:hypothetical protein
MRRNLKLAVAAMSAGLGLAMLGGCVAPARTQSDAYYAPPPARTTTTTTTYYEPGYGPETTGSTATVYEERGYYPPSGHGDTYDDPHHYGRGYNQHKY